jgi:hypothetical protein
MPSNKALQTDKVNLSCLLHSQKPRQLAFAAELGCCAAGGRWRLTFAGDVDFLDLPEVAMISSRRRAIKILGGAGAVLVASGSAVWAWLRQVPAAGPVIDFDPHTPLDYPFPEAAAHTAPLPLTPSCGDQHPTDSDIEGPYYTPHTPLRTNLNRPDIPGGSIL